MRNGSSYGRNSYHQMPENRRKRGFPAKIWVSLKRVAAKSIGFYVGRRRFLAGIVKRVVWISLDLKRRVVGRVARARRVRLVPTSYDSFSYSQNFDDGRWQLEEVEFYRSRSFAFRFGQSGVLGF